MLNSALFSEGGENMSKGKKLVLLIIASITILSNGCGIVPPPKTHFVKPGIFKGEIIFKSDRDVQGCQLYMINADGT